jgi:hypothetical protein
MVETVRENDKNASLSANAKPLTNAVNSNKGQKSPSEMIQEYEDLFRQEFLDVNGAEKVFAKWKELKRVVLMRVLDATIKQLTATSQAATMGQKGPVTWASIMRGGSTPMEKPVPKRLEREITISRRECPPLDGEEAKPAKIVENINTKLGEGSKGKIVAARKLPSGDVVLTTNTTEAKGQLMKEMD